MHVARKHKIPKHKLFATLSPPKTSTATPSPPPPPLSCISSQVSRSGRSSLSALGERGSCGCSICLPSPPPSSRFTLHAFAVSFYASNSNSLGLWLTLSCFAVYRVAPPPLPPPPPTPFSRESPASERELHNIFRWLKIEIDFYERNRQVTLPR